MFQLTAAAANQLAGIRHTRGIPDSAGLRVYSEPLPSGERGMALGFADMPASDDLVTEQQGTRVFVAAEMAEQLSDSSLDVADTPDGPKLTVRPSDFGAS